MGYLTDILLVAFLLVETWLGCRSGLLWQATDLAALGLGLLLGMLLAAPLGSLLLGTLAHDPFSAQVIAFFFLMGMTCLLLRLLATWVAVRSERGLAKPEREERRRHDRILGGMFGALKGSLLAMLLVAAGVSLWPRHLGWETSRLAGPLAQAGARLLPEGAVFEVRDWVAGTALRLGSGLRIQSRESETRPALPSSAEQAAR